MTVSVFDLFSIGIGPSSSHTVGPMRAAQAFAESLVVQGLLEEVAAVKVELYGSLAATGWGHGTDRAVVLGLEGHDPETVDTGLAADRTLTLGLQPRLSLAGGREIHFDLETDLVLRPLTHLPYHPNGMRFRALDDAGHPLASRTSYSVGGGFVIDEPAETVENPILRTLPYPYTSAVELLDLCREAGLRISDIAWENECAARPADAVRAHIQRVWQVMQDCVTAGCHSDGILPGGLGVRRRAPALFRGLSAQGADQDALAPLDWVNLFAMAVNEENAAGGRVVTAPTNGAAGIIPAVLHYLVGFCTPTDDAGHLTQVERFILTATAIGSLYRENASISGAEVGCQGEVGSASSMAAAGLCEVLGGSPEQVENAAEIAMEHNLGLTCDPIGGLVQVPCIERNAMGAAKAINATRMALRGDGTHLVSLDQVIRTMRQTGADMKSAYKETSLAGLAVNVVDC